MKILVFGADGFIGKSVVEELSSRHEVYRASRQQTNDANSVRVDLTDRESIAKALDNIKPEVLINCAGVVDNSEKAQANPVFTTNLLEEAAASKLSFRRIIISGSAAEYGVVDAKNIPVNENAPLNASAGYGLSKLQEVKIALEMAKKYNLPVVVARIFNPIGAGMHQRFLIPKLIQQVKEAVGDTDSKVEVNRLDAKRDYLNVKDVASAISVLVENNPKEQIYNIGSGNATTTQELIELILNEVNLPTLPRMVESSDTPEQLVAIQADVSRLQNEFNWSPKYSLKATVKEIINASR